MEFFRTDKRQLADAGPKTLCLGAECSCCHTVEWVPCPTENQPPPEFAAQLFRKRGWDVGKRRKDDVCARCKGSKVRPAAPDGWFERLSAVLGPEPRHASAGLFLGGFQTVPTSLALAIAQGDPAVELLPTQSQDARRLVPLMHRLGFSGPKGVAIKGRGSLQCYRRPDTLRDTRVETPYIPPLETAEMSPTPPNTDVRQPTREERRKIVDFLDGNYDLDKQCYIGDLNDQAVATKLNLPRAWVSEERERMYGPEANQAGEKLVERYDELVAKAGKIETDVVALMERADACIKEIKQLEPAVAALRRR